jgi:hypothetical protein
MDHLWPWWSASIYKYYAWLIKGYKGVDLAVYLSTSKIDFDSKVGALFTAFVRDEKMDLLFFADGLRYSRIRVIK